MGIPTVKLNYKLYAGRGTDDEIAYKVPWENVNNVNSAIKIKTEKNKGEQVRSLEAKSYVVGGDGEER